LLKRNATRYGLFPCRALSEGPRRDFPLALSLGTVSGINGQQNLLQFVLLKIAVLSAETAGGSLSTTTHAKERRANKNGRFCDRPLFASA
jgi:hypothetical protein